jgi:hypothetical protein
MGDSLRPPGTVEIQCPICRWCFWVDCNDPALPDGPFECPSCEEIRSQHLNNLSRNQ